MKLRIRDNSVRLRLMRGEVDRLRDDGRVAGATEFPGGRTFGYVVESSPAVITADASLAGNTITVQLPESVVLGWAQSEQVSISDELQLDDGGSLAILVEKDFACLAPREGEDESEMFPHPRAADPDAAC